jgi:hypothetical protein
VRLEMLYHLLDAVFLVLRNLIFKFVPTGQWSCLVCFVNLEKLCLDQRRNRCYLLKTFCLSFVSLTKFFKVCLDPLKFWWNLFLYRLFDLSWKLIYDFLGECWQKPVIDKLWSKVLHNYDWLFKVCQNMLEFILQVMDLLRLFKKFYYALRRYTHMLPQCIK